MPEPTPSINPLKRPHTKALVTCTVLFGFMLGSIGLAVGTEHDTDHIPPETTLLSAPDAEITVREATYRFSSSESGSFQCQKDGGAWVACSSPMRLSGLADGRHVLAVTAIDVAGNDDPTPLVHVFTVSASVAVSSVTPSTAVVGTERLAVTVTGSGFLSSDTFSFGSGVSVVSSRYNSSTSFSLVLDVSRWAEAGSRSVGVPGREAPSSTVAFQVTTPVVVRRVQTVPETVVVPEPAVRAAPKVRKKRKPAAAPAPAPVFTMSDAAAVAAETTRSRPVVVAQKNTLADARYTGDTEFELNQVGDRIGTSMAQKVPGTPLPFWWLLIIATGVPLAFAWQLWTRSWLTAQGGRT